MNLLTGLISAAWWTQKASTVPVVAVAIVALIGATLVSATGGLWWLRENAKDEERQVCALAQTTAKETAEAQMRKRLKASEDLATLRRAEVLRELQAARERMEDLEVALARVPTKAVCYPKDIARRLNNGR